MDTLNRRKRIICEKRSRDERRGKNNNRQYSHRTYWESEFRDENTWLRAASVVCRRTGRSLINSFFSVRCVVSMCIDCERCVSSSRALFLVCMAMFGQIFPIFFIIHFRGSISFTGVCFRFLICGPLSQFQCSVLRFFPLISSDTFSHSFGWLIYHFDYWPLYALENCAQFETIGPGQRQ